MSQTYDTAGRLSTEVSPAGTKTHNYYPAGSTGPGVAPGKISGISGPMGTDLSYSYDGTLLTGVTWSGDVEGAATYGYDNNFWKISETVSGGT